MTPPDAHAAGGPTPDSASPTGIDWSAVHARLARVRQAGESDHDPDRTQALLAKRANALARGVRQAADEGEAIDVVVFELAQQRYAAPAVHAREALHLSALTPLPGLPVHVRGVVNVRSRIIPAIDLRPLLNLRRVAEATVESLLILMVDGDEFGLTTDGIRGVQRLPLGELRQGISGVDQRYLRGVTAEGLMLLDLTALLPAITLTAAS